MKETIFKKWLVLLGIVLITAFPMACSDDKESNELDPGPLTEVFEVKDHTELLFEKEANSVKLELLSNVSWTAVSTGSWCTLSKISGTGDDEIEVEVSGNGNVDERRCQVVLRGGSKKVTLDVVQLGEKVQTIVYVSGTEIPDGEDANRAVFDFEKKQYLIHVLSNADMNFTFVSTSWMQYRESETSGYATVGDYQKWYDILLHDNEGGVRSTTFTMKQKMGDYERVITIEQSKSENFVRLFEDSIMLGSHFNVMEVLARTNVHWEYEIKGDVSWLSNWRTRNMPGASTYALGQRSYLLADVEKNESNDPRGFELVIKYIREGQSVEQTVKIIQLGNNSVASDSLVLMDLVRRNSNPNVGLEVPWILSSPVTSWEKVTFNTVNGERRMVELDMRSTLMTYELTTSIANLSELTTLYIAKNYLSGALPEEMSRMVWLQRLDISENYTDAPDDSPSLTITGIEEIPAVIFEKCTRLKTLNVTMNRLRSLPATIENLTLLEEFECGTMPVMSEFPVAAFRKLTNMRDLWISDLRLWEGDFLDFIFEMPRLESIGIARMKFKAGTTLPDKFDLLPELTSLRIQETTLGGEIPKTLLSCSGLTSLQFGVNQMEGELLPDLSSLKKLQIVDLTDNNFTGTIPADYAKFGSEVGTYVDEDGETKVSQRGDYTHLFLYGNRLTGVVPDAIKQTKMWSNAPFCWEPETYICPQQEGYSFDNCSL